MKLFARGSAPTTQIRDDVVISIQGVTKQFGSHTVLEDISFDVPRGHTTAVLGPSGTGKSVLLKVIIGLLRPEAGQVFIDGEPLVGIPEKDLLRIRRKFGVLFQDGALFGSMSLYDNIAFPMREHTKASERQIRTQVYEKAELVGLMAHLQKLPGEVSGGMKKRAGLARALVLEPEIILFDEPDSGLDPVRVAYLDDLVNTAQAETNSTFFIITHNIESVKRTAHYMGLLFRSGLVKFGSKEEMLTTNNPVVRQFLAGRAEGPISMDEMAEGDDGPDDAGYLDHDPPGPHTAPFDQGPSSPYRPRYDAGAPTRNGRPPIARRDARPPTRNGRPPVVDPGVIDDWPQRPDGRR